MQTLLLFRHLVRPRAVAVLCGFEALGKHVFADRAEDMRVSDDGISTHGFYNNELLDRWLAVTPSMVVVDGDEEDFGNKSYYTDLMKGLQRFPWTYQTFFSSGKMRTALKQICATSEEHCPIYGQAYVHMTFDDSALISILNFEASDKQKSLDVEREASIRNALMYELSRVYPMIRESVMASGNPTLPRSAVIEVTFGADDTISSDVMLYNLERISIDMLATIPCAKQLTEGIAADLVKLAQKLAREEDAEKGRYFDAAAALNMRCEPLIADSLLISRDGYSSILMKNFGTLQSEEAVERLSSPKAISDCLEPLGVKMATRITVERTEVTEESVSKLAKQVKGSMMLKPADCDPEDDIFGPIDDNEELLEAVSLLPDYVQKIHIEECFAGTLYRMIVIGDRVVAAWKNANPVVYGDGIHKLREIFGAYNVCNECKIRVTQALQFFIKTYKYTLDDVLELGQRFTLYPSQNGGAWRNVTSSLNSLISKKIVDCAKALELSVVSFDLVMDDEGHLRIYEINPTPDLSQKSTQSFGADHDLYQDILEYGFTHTNDEFNSVWYLRELHG